MLTSSFALVQVVRGERLAARRVATHQEDAEHHQQEEEDQHHQADGDDEGAGEEG